MKNNGFTLVGALVGIALIVIVFWGLLGAYRLTIKVLFQSKARIGATAVGNEILEEIRNLPYEKVGVKGGYPDGDLDATSTVYLNNIEYHVAIRIDYVDDAKDGMAPDDSCPNDYKKVNVNVSWGKTYKGEVSFDDLIAPQNTVQECGETGGVLKVSVFNALGDNVSSPSVEVKNINTGLVKTATPQSGVHYFVLPEGTDAYKITISKDGYSHEETYGVGDTYNGKTIATPEKQNATLLKGQMTETSFSIDKLSNFDVYTLEAKAEHIYYVRKTGSDSNNGLSPDSAFLTIQKAASSTEAGDMVFVGAGTYDEEVNIPNSGTSDKKIIFVADTSGNYTGDSGEVKISANNNYGFYISGQKYIEIYGFEIGNASSSAVYISGSNSSDIELVNNTIALNSGDGIYVQGASNVVISNNQIYSNRKGVYLDSANSASLVGNIVHDNSSDGIFLEKSGKFDLDFNETFSNGRDGILVSNNSNNGKIQNNTSYLNSQNGIEAYDHIASVDVLENKSYSNSGKGIAFNGNVSNTNKIASNLVYDNQESGISLSDNCVNNTISNNTVFKNKGEGILIELGSGNNTIKDNIVAENDSAGIKVSDSQGIDEDYDDLWQNNPNCDGLLSGSSTISADPLLVDPDGADNALGGNNGSDDAFYLSQTAAGQSTSSPCVDSGSDSAANLGMDDKTTRTDNVLDSGKVDMGFHYSLESPPSSPPTPDPFGYPVPNTDFDLRGDKSVGKDEDENEIYKYEKSQETDDNGFLKISDLEWDSYTFSNFSASNQKIDLIVSYPAPPNDGKVKVDLYPNTTTTVKLGLRASNTLLVKVEDSQTSAPIFSAKVRLHNDNYDKTQFTNEQGETYFIPLEKTNYNIDVEADGYNSSLDNSVLVSGHVSKTISLEKK